MSTTFKSRYGLIGNVSVYVDPNATATTPQLVGYKGKSVFDTAVWYTPYIPLTMTGVVFPRGPVTVSISETFTSVTESEWFPYEVDVQFSYSDDASRSPAVNVLLDWCFEVWGEPGICEPSLWCWNNGKIFVHHSEMVMEVKLRWHKTTFNV